ncbi:DUF1700 domain-containing protein [Cohnella ginsengisoli]|uniref:DUF1700 domain-containing protein n=1 Tax=Cohnella ginsengisoli TaxID=425004 RepID=A0A9X4KLU3_9BACL|nr:DUF1700 domain-containing protein [Cohnella ginsengisoli]MDG0794408.1 DUF1700 domain-containing protein [Cohnella ginsengisoli]
MELCRPLNAQKWGTKVNDNNRSAHPAAVALLSLLGIFAIPLGLALWAVLSALAAANIALIAAPVAVLLDWTFNGDRYPATLFISLAVTGFGMLAALGTIAAFKVGIRLTAGVLAWSGRIRKGRSSS